MVGSQAFCRCFALGNCLHFALPAKISCKHGAFHSVWEIEFLFILTMAVKTKLPKTFRIDCFKGEHSVFQGCFIVAETCMLKSQAFSDFVDYNVERDISTLVQKCSFFS